MSVKTADPTWTQDPVDWDSPTWGHNPMHVASYVDAEAGDDQ